MDKIKSNVEEDAVKKWSSYQGREVGRGGARMFCEDKLDPSEEVLKSSREVMFLKGDQREVWVSRTGSSVALSF